MCHVKDIKTRYKAELIAKYAPKNSLATEVSSRAEGNSVYAFAISNAATQTKFQLGQQ